MCLDFVFLFLFKNVKKKLAQSEVSLGFYNFFRRFNDIGDGLGCISNEFS